MASHYQTSKIFVVVGTGAQGLPVVRGLVSDRKYSCLVLTRDLESQRARQLTSLPNVTLLKGSFASEATLLEGYSQCDGAFINIDGFNTGETTETYWAIRAYELALQAGIKFFVYGNLDYVLKKSGYSPDLKTGHYDGKGRMGEWILQQTKDNGGKMGAALFTTGPYIEMAIAASTPMSPVVEDGVVTWRVPLGDGAVVHVALEDCAYYVRWLFDNPQRSNGMDLEVAIEHVHYADLAAAFEKVAGHPARYVDTSLEDYWSKGQFGRLGHVPAAYNDEGGVTRKHNFTGFWNMWKYSGRNEGVIKRDYNLLDEIFPRRIKSVEEWFRREENKGIAEGKGNLWERVQKRNIKPILKIAEDSGKGKL